MLIPIAAFPHMSIATETLFKPDVVSPLLAQTLQQSINVGI
jgi:hypothetical protein